MNKYRNIRTDYRGEMYDSKKEAEFARFLDLSKREKNPAKRPIQIIRQPSYPIIIKGEKICTYRADFYVRYADGHEDIIDVKGKPTREYLLKKKLVHAIHGIDVIEV